jgi:hypothetical protein
MDRWIGAEAREDGLNGRSEISRAAGTYADNAT